MNKNLFIVIAGGFFIAILVAVLVQATLKGGKKEVDVARVEILVAAKNLAVGKEIKSGDLKWQVWPESVVFVGAIKRVEQQDPTEAISGKLLRSLSLGQPLHSSIVAQENQGDFLSANVQKGMRAVGVSVKSYVVADRLVRPGDFVDVMVTYRVNVNARTNPEAQSLVSKYASETVIENVRILAIDNNDTKAVDEEEEGGKSKKRKKSSKKATVTIEVMPSDAEKLVLANKMGDIGLALRSIGDNSDPKTDRATTDVGMSKVMTNLSSMNGNSSAVRIYAGDQMTEVRARNVESEEGVVNFSVEDEPQPEQRVYITPEALQSIQEQE